jgi:hypothetical protein
MDGPATAFPSTTDAVALKSMAAQGMFGGAIVDGPLTPDSALSADAARTNGVTSEVAGHVDVLIAPSMESALMVLRTLLAFNAGLAAGIVLGARIPIVIPARNDSMEVRMASCVLASLAASAVGEAVGSQPAGLPPRRIPKSPRRYVSEVLRRFRSTSRIRAGRHFAPDSAAANHVVVCVFRHAASSQHTTTRRAPHALRRRRQFALGGVPAPLRRSVNRRGRATQSRVGQGASVAVGRAGRRGWRGKRSLILTSVAAPGTRRPATCDRRPLTRPDPRDEANWRGRGTYRPFPGTAPARTQSM